MGSLGRSLSQAHESTVTIRGGTWSGWGRSSRARGQGVSTQTVQVLVTEGGPPAPTLIVAAPSSAFIPGPAAGPQSVV